MISTVFGVICGLVILWAIQMRLGELAKKCDDLDMSLFTIKTTLEDINAKLKQRG